MEAKLREYRALRRRKELEQKEQEEAEARKPLVTPKMDKEKNEDIVPLINEEQPSPIEPLPVRHNYDESQLLDIPTESSELSSYDETEPNPESWRYFFIKWTMYMIIWFTVWMFFLKVGFGAVYFAASILIFICVNTRTRRKQIGEPSAYSVFNENCESIEGTLEAEELQRQMLFGIVGIRTV